MQTKSDIRDRHEPVARKILAAVGLGVATFKGFEEVGWAIVRFRDDNTPIYGCILEVDLGLHVSGPASAEDLASARALASRVVQPGDLDTVIRLLSSSMEPDKEKLRRFLSAWMALEVFVNKNFRNYSERFWTSISANVSTAVRDRYLNRIHDVMKDKYTTLDKFVLISAELDPSEADSDIDVFSRGKKLRDEFSHGEAVDENGLPVDEVQRLVRKLIRLHLDRTN